MQTVASKRLKAMLEKGGEWSQVKLARELGVSRQAVKQWIDGVAKPETGRMAEIEDLLRIPMRSWAQTRTAKRTGTDG